MNTWRRREDERFQMHRGLRPTGRNGLARPAPARRRWASSLEPSLGGERTCRGRWSVSADRRDGASRAPSRCCHAPRAHPRRLHEEGLRMQGVLGHVQKSLVEHHVASVAEAIAQLRLARPCAAHKPRVSRPRGIFATKHEPWQPSRQMTIIAQCSAAGVAEIRNRVVPALALGWNGCFPQRSAVGPSWASLRIWAPGEGRVCDSLFLYGPGGAWPTARGPGRPRPPPSTRACPSAAPPATRAAVRGA